MKALGRVDRARRAHRICALPHTELSSAVATADALAQASSKWATLAPVVLFALVPTVAKHSSPSNTDDTKTNLLKLGQVTCCAAL